MDARAEALLEHLQSTMVRLRRVTAEVLPSIRKKFTIHYGEIKTAPPECRLPQNSHLQSTMVRLRPRLRRYQVAVEQIYNPLW